MQDILVLLDNIFVIINIIILYIFAIGFWIKIRNAEIESQKWLFFCLGLFMICFGLTRLFFMFSDMIKAGYWESTDLGWLVLDFSFWWKMAALFGIGSLIAVLFVLEKYSVKTKYIFTIIATIGLILAIILPVSTELTIDARFMTYITVPIAVLSILGIYLYLIIKTTGKIRLKSTMAFLGILILMIGFILDTEAGKMLVGFDLSIFNSILMITGIILFSFANLKK
ncbi:MAG: hypothetical protein ACTSRP_11715 [Candidatus Helarchaeota archaeon]